VINGLELAFAAFNSPQWTEFIVRVKTPVGADVEVYHYGRVACYNAKNEIIALA
jgi:hypothetical protein